MSLIETKGRPGLAIWIALAGLLLVTLLLWIMADGPRMPERLFGYWRLREVGLALGLLLASTGWACVVAGRMAFIKFCATVIPVIGVLGLFEGAGRSGLINWNMLLGQPVADRAYAPGWTLQPDISVQGETRQDIAVRFGMPNDPIPFDFTTDGYGFRNADDPEGTIVVVGDSIVVGAAVPREQTVAEVIENRLGLPVMQAALIGTSIQEQHQLLAQSGLPLGGKTIVQFLFEGNDLLDSRAFRQRDSNAEANPADTSVSSASFLRLMWSKLERLSNPPARYDSCTIDGDFFGFLWTRFAFDGVQNEFEHIAEAIETFQDSLAEIDAQYALVMVPTKYRVLKELCTFPADSQIANPADNLSDLPMQLRSWSENAGVPFLDLTPALGAAARSGDIPWFWGDTHWNERGHAVAGDTVAAWLEDRLAR